MTLNENNSKIANEDWSMSMNPSTMIDYSRSKHFTTAVSTNCHRSFHERRD